MKKLNKNCKCLACVMNIVVLLQHKARNSVTSSASRERAYRTDEGWSKPFLPQAEMLANCQSAFYEEQRHNDAGIGKLTMNINNEVG